MKTNPFNIIDEQQAADLEKSGALSLSQTTISTAKDCLRKYYLSYKHPEFVSSDEPEHFRFGTAYHKVAEDWLSRGKPPDMATKEGRLFAAAIHHYPAPDRSFVIEKRIHATRELDGSTILYGGTPDLITPYIQSIWDHEATPDLILWDHKTTSNISFAKTRETLPSNIQSIVYTLMIGAAYGVDEVGLSWITAEKKTQKTRKGQAILSQEQARDNFDRLIIPTEKKLLDVHRAGVLKPKSITPNYDSCTKYGGCEFWELYCKYHKTGRQEEMGKLDLSKFKSKEQDQEQEEKQEQIKPKEKPKNADNNLIAKLKNEKQESKINAPEGGKDPASADSTKKISTEHKEKDQPSKPKQSSKNKTPSLTGIGTLYIGCIPQGEDYLTLSNLLCGEIEELNDQFGGHWSFAEYGKGPGLVSARAVAYFRDNYVEAVFVDKSSSLDRACLSALEAKAGRVVRVVG